LANSLTVYLYLIICHSSVTKEAVGVPPPDTSASPAPSGLGGGGSSVHAPAGAIVGGIFGGLTLLLLAGAIAILLHRQRRQRGVNDGLELPRPYQNPPNMATRFGGLSVVPTDPSSKAVVVTPSHAPGADVFPLVSPKAQLISGGCSAPAPAPMSLNPSSQPGSSHQPPRDGVESSASRVTDELRSEMQHLRREVEQLRATQSMLQEAPPGYH
jgi:hypothetical protein